ncbi:MAG: ABC transporter substrate-binding protein/permease [Bavariicoccus seileri]|uniref:ABC transporter substrate-binding protein/permease n=1 Tax=Bavariicoccus seileri TaxID=549685 RepID=UPI003F9A0C93
MNQLIRKRSTLLVILTTLIVTCIYFITSVTTAHAAETVKVGISARSKSYNYHDDNGKLTGFEIEVLEEVDQRLDDYSFTYDTTEFASLFAGLDAGKFDVIANNIGEKDERREKYLFSLYPYVITHNVIITNSEDGKTVTLADLAGKTMGIVAGSAQAVFMEKYNEENPDQAVVLQYVDADAATIISDVHSGRYDATIYSTTYVKDVEDTYGITLTESPIADEDAIQPPGAYLLYRKDEKSLALRNAIDGVLADMREDGTLKTISEKYFSEDQTVLDEAIIAKNDALNQSNNTTDRVVIVGTSGQTKPMDYFDDNNQLTGFEIDVLSEIEKRVEGISFKYETAEFASLFAGLDSEKFDVLANNLGESGDRREKYLFSLYPYVVTHNVLITASDNPDQTDDLTFDDMAGKSFGVVPASPQSQFLEAWNEENPDKAVDIQYLDSDPSQIIRDVHSGRFDATIYATTYLHDVEQTFGIELKASPIADEDAIRPPGSYFIYRQNDVELRDQMDKALAEMREDGTLAEISQKYLGQDDTVLSPELIAKNDAIEAERKGADKETSSTDGKIFAPEMIPGIIKQIIPRLPITIFMTLVSAMIGLILGFLIAIVKIRKIPVLSQFFSVFVSFMRGTPQLVQLFLAFYGFPLIVQWFNQRLSLNWDSNAIPALVYVFIAFGLNEAAYNSETFRAAILSVNTSEIEAARSIGLTNRQTMMRIILPSALIVAIPNLGNSIISLLKGTSLAFTVTVIDIMGRARIIAGSNLRFFEAYISVALIYWVFCIVIERFVKWVEKRLNVDQAESTDDGRLDVDQTQV